MKGQWLWNQKRTKNGTQHSFTIHSLTVYVSIAFFNESGWFLYFLWFVFKGMLFFLIVRDGSYLVLLIMQFVGDWSTFVSMLFEKCLLDDSLLIQKQSVIGFLTDYLLRFCDIIVVSVVSIDLSFVVIRVYLWESLERWIMGREVSKFNLQITHSAHLCDIDT